jgi:hypothetical protein
MWFQIQAYIYRPAAIAVGISSSALS